MQEITAADILAADPDVQIIDVREASELPTGMIEDAVHLPSGSVLERADELDKSRRVIAVCHGGGRSGRVAEALTGLGFNADTLVGGMSGWEVEGLSMAAPEVQFRRTLRKCHRWHFLNLAQFNRCRWPGAGPCARPAPDCPGRRAPQRTA